MAKLESLELIVEGRAIHCTVCEGHINGVISKIPGVVSVKADYNEQKIFLSLDQDKNPLVQVLTTLEFMGYATVQGADYRGLQ